MRSSEHKAGASVLTCSPCQASPCCCLVPPSLPGHWPAALGPAQQGDRLRAHIPVLCFPGSGCPCPLSTSECAMLASKWLSSSPARASTVGTGQPQGLQDAKASWVSPGCSSARARLPSLGKAARRVPQALPALPPFYLHGVRQGGCGNQTINSIASPGRTCEQTLPPEHLLYRARPRP